MLLTIVKYPVIFISFFCVFYVNAQTHFSSELYAGIQGGATVSQVGFSPRVQQNILSGINGGIFLRYISEKNVGLQGELNFSQSGWAEKDTTFLRRLSYIEMPFLTHIYIGQKMRFIINLGPQISYMITENATAAHKNSGIEQHINNVQNRFDYGFCLGLGGTFPIASNHLQIELRGYYGMGDIYSNAKTEYFARSNNLRLSLNLAWLFKLN